MKTFVCTLLLAVSASSAFGQDAPTADPINGVWKLDLDKSKNTMAAPESEVITIVKEDGTYKLTFDVKKSNG